MIEILGFWAMAISWNRKLGHAICVL